MQTRRVFLSGLINLATFATSGGLVVAGKEKGKVVLQEPENPAIVLKEAPDTVNSPVITFDRASDFTLGGVLGVAVKKVIEKSIKLKQVNKELSATVSKLQKLEKNDLPGIKKTLEEFIEKEGIRYEANRDSNLAESILGLINAISIHVSSQNKSVKPFLEELQKLREAMAVPFTKQLQSGGEVDAATKGVVIEVLRGKKLTEYLETTVVNALKDSGVGDKIGKHTVNSLARVDLISDEGEVALRQTITKILGEPRFVEALTYTACYGVTEYGIVDDLIEALTKKFRTCLQDDDVEAALKKTLIDAISDKGMADQLAQDFIVQLQMVLKKPLK